MTGKDNAPRGSSACRPSAAFRCFEADDDVHIYRRSMPHWQQQVATYFVTFRQADSIPKTVLAKWLDIQTRWFRAHAIELAWKRTDPKRFSEAYQKVPLEQRRHFEREQARMLHDELDRCHGSCVLRGEEPRKIVTDSLFHFHGSRMWLGDFAILPNHVHLLLQPFSDWKLASLLGSIKRWSSRKIRELFGDRVQADLPPATNRFWQPESYDRIVRDWQELAAVRQYIASDPRRSRLSHGEFTYHRASWLSKQ